MFWKKEATEYKPIYLRSIERWCLFPLHIHPCRGPRGPFLGLPRHMLSSICFCKPSAERMFYKICCRRESQVRKGKSCSACVGAECVGLGSIGLPVMHGHLPADTGHPSAELPQIFRSACFCARKRGAHLQQKALSLLL